MKENGFGVRWCTFIVLIFSIEFETDYIPLKITWMGNQTSMKQQARNENNNSISSSMNVNRDNRNRNEFVEF